MNLNHLPHSLTPFALGRTITFFLLATTGVTHAQAAGAPSSVLANVPVLFEQNVGQHKTGKFRAVGSEFSVAFEDGQAHITSRDGSATSMVFVDAQTATLRGEKPAAMRADYFRGHTKQDWRLNVPMFHQVRYANLYPGIDTVYYGSGRRLEYDFIVSPDADPHRIRFRIEGARRVDIDDTGALIADTGNGHVHRHARPVAYQMSLGQRTAVPARFVKSRTGDIGFQVGAYDRSRTLIIDPVLTFSTYIGRDLDDEGVDVAVDSAGNIYVLGNMLLHSTAPGTFGTDKDTFLYKLSPDGTNVLYAALIGGTYTDEAHGLAVDDSGRAYITGKTSSSDFPISSTAYLTTPRKVPNALICAIDTNAVPESSLLYSSYFPADIGNAIALDSYGNVYITGTASWGFTTTPGAFQTTCPSCSYSTDAFVAKFDFRNSGEASLIYSTYLGGSTVPVLGTGNDTGLGIVVDSAGEAIVTGEASSSDFPTRNAMDDTYNSGISDVFVAKINTNGTDLVFSTLLGTEGVDSGRGITLDPSGNIYVTGFTNWYDFPTTAGAWQKQWNANQCGSVYNDPCPDAFVTKLSPTGALLYSTYLGGTLPDYGYDVAVDSAGNAYVTGHTISFNFPLVNQLPEVSTGANDAFITALNADGTGILFSTLIGGSLKDEGNAIALYGSQVIVAGTTIATDFPVVNAGQPANAGGTDAFVVKFPLPGTAPSLSTLAVSPASAVSNASTTRTVKLSKAGPTAGSVIVTQAAGTSSAGATGQQ